MPKPSFLQSIFRKPSQHYSYSSRSDNDPNDYVPSRASGGGDKLSRRYSNAPSAAGSWSGPSPYGQQYSPTAARAGDRDIYEGGAPTSRPYRLASPGYQQEGAPAAEPQGYFPPQQQQYRNGRPDLYDETGLNGYGSGTGGEPNVVPSDASSAVSGSPRNGKRRWRMGGGQETTTRRYGHGAQVPVETSYEQSSDQQAGSDGYHRSDWIDPVYLPSSQGPRPDAVYARSSGRSGPAPRLERRQLSDVPYVEHPTNGGPAGAQRAEKTFAMGRVADAVVGAPPMEASESGSSYESEEVEDEAEEEQEEEEVSPSRQLTSTSFGTTGSSASPHISAVPFPSSPSREAAPTFAEAAYEPASGSSSSNATPAESVAQPQPQRRPRVVSFDQQAMSAALQQESEDLNRRRTKSTRHRNPNLPPGALQFSDHLSLVPTSAPPVTYSTDAEASLSRSSTIKAATQDKPKKTKRKDAQSTTYPAAEELVAVEGRRRGFTSGEPEITMDENGNFVFSNGAASLDGDAADVTSGRGAGFTDRPPSRSGTVKKPKKKSQSVTIAAVPEEITEVRKRKTSTKSSKSAKGSKVAQPQKEAAPPPPAPTIPEEPVIRAVPTPRPAPDSPAPPPPPAAVTTPVPAQGKTPEEVIRALQEAGLLETVLKAVGVATVASSPPASPPVSVPAGLPIDTAPHNHSTPADRGVPAVSEDTEVFDDPVTPAPDAVPADFQTAEGRSSGRDHAQASDKPITSMAPEAVDSPPKSESVDEARERRSSNALDSRPTDDEVIVDELLARERQKHLSNTEKPRLANRASSASLQPPAPRDLIVRSRPNSAVLLKLERLSLASPTPEAHQIAGTVSAANLSYNKSVSIRYTLDAWKSHEEVAAKWVESMEGGRRDRFGFSLDIRDDQLPGGKATLSIAARMDAEGFKVWDNNGGQNYDVELVAASAPSVLEPGAAAVTAHTAVAATEDGKSVPDARAGSAAEASVTVAPPSDSANRGAPASQADTFAPSTETKPPTQAPTTQAPTTQAPTAQAPTAQAPTEADGAPTPKQKSLALSASPPLSAAETDAFPSRAPTPSTTQTTPASSQVSSNRRKDPAQVGSHGKAPIGTLAPPKINLRRTDSERQISEHDGDITLEAPGTPAAKSVRRPGSVLQKPVLAPSAAPAPAAVMMLDSRAGQLSSRASKTTLGKTRLSAEALRQIEAEGPMPTKVKKTKSKKSLSKATSPSSSRPASIMAVEGVSATSAAAAAPGWEKRARTLGSGITALAQQPVQSKAPKPKKVKRAPAKPTMSRQVLETQARRASLSVEPGQAPITAKVPRRPASVSGISVTSSRASSASASNYSTFGTFTTMPSRAARAENRALAPSPSALSVSRPRSASPVPEAVPEVAEEDDLDEEESEEDEESEEEPDVEEEDHTAMQASLGIPEQRPVTKRASFSGFSFSGSLRDTASAPGSVTSQPQGLRGRTMSLRSPSSTPMVSPPPSRVMSLRSNSTSGGGASISGYNSFVVPSGAYQPSRDPSRVAMFGSENLQNLQGQVTMHSLSLRHGINDSEQSRKEAMQPLPPHLARRLNIAPQLAFGNLSPIPKQLKSHELLVEVHAVGIDFWDLAVAATMARRPDGFGYIPGRSFCGRILECGYEVTKLRKGDFVYGLQELKKSSALAEHLTIAKDLVAIAPDTGMSIEQIAGLPLAGVPAYEAMQALCSTLPRGSKVLVLNGHEGVGAIACQLAGCLRSMRDIWITSQCPQSVAEGERLCRGFGASDVIVDDPLTAINSIHEASFDVVLDTVGGRRIYDAARRILHHDGQFITTVGDELAVATMGAHWKTSIRSLKRSFFKKDKKNISYWSVSFDEREATYEALHRLAELGREGHLKPVVRRVLRFEDAAAAFNGEEMEGDGGVVIRVAAEIDGIEEGIPEEDEEEDGY